MEARTTRVRWTWAEFARLPDKRGHRQEIIADELVVTPGPRPRHQGVVMRLGAALHGFVDEHGLGAVFPGPIDIIFAEGDYLEPDLIFLRAGRDRLVTDRGIEGPPDLVVEVASPSTAVRDRGIKRDRYRLYQVPEYWVVDPDARTLEVWKPADEGAQPCVYHAGDTFKWKPGASDPSLTLVISALFSS